MGGSACLGDKNQPMIPKPKNHVLHVRVRVLWLVKVDVV